MGNSCLRPALALDGAPPDVNAPALFALRHPEKYRCVRELEETIRYVQDNLAQHVGPDAAIVWDDYDSVSRRSCINCLENQMLHLKTSVAPLKTSAVQGRKARKTVSVCETVEVFERWGDAGAFLFESEEPAMPPSSGKDASAPALIWKTLTYADPKARLSTTSLSTLATCWEGRSPSNDLSCWEGDAPSNDLSGASTPVISSETSSLFTWA